MAVLAAASALATAVVIAAGMTPSSAQVAALAAAREHASATRDVIAAGELASQRPVTVNAAPATAPDDVPGGSGSGGSSGTAPAASPVAAAAPVVPAPVASTTPSAPPGSPATAPAAPSLDHVFEIVVSAADYASAFGAASPMPYLRSLTSKGTLLSGYSSLGQGELADELALVGGQPPNTDTSAGCPTYAEFPTGTTADADGIVSATGCVYPETVLSIGDQVTSSGHTWRAYVDGMGAAACVHPNSGAADDAVLPGAGPTYDTRANPFIYFHSLLDLGDCASDDVDLGHLQHGLRASTKAPTFTFIAPGICEAAATLPSAPGTTSSSSAAPNTTTTTATTSTPSTTTSAAAPTSVASTPQCPAGAPSGPAAADAFLRQWVPRVLASPAYRSKGALLITVAAATAQSHPVRTGALVISPLASRGRILRSALTPYAVLRETETALGYAALAEAKTASKAMSAVFR